LYKLVCILNSSRELGEGTGTLLKLLLPRLLASTPLITRLLKVLFWPVTKIIGSPRPAAVASGSEAEVFALFASKKRKFRVKSGRLLTISFGSVSLSVALVVFIVCTASPDTTTSVAIFFISIVTVKLVTSVIFMVTALIIARRKPSCSIVILYS